MTATIAITTTASTTITIKIGATTITNTKITRLEILKTNNSTNEKAVDKKKLNTYLQEIRKEKYANFLNLKTYEEQTDQNDLPDEINQSDVLIPPNS